MSRYIDADNFFKQFPELDTEPYNNLSTIFTQEDIDNVLELAYISGQHHPERPKGEWIPVTERLPEGKMFNPSGSDFDFEEVLCTTIWEDVRVYKFGKPVGHEKAHFWLACGIMDGYVIAWQPLPEPYKRGDV